MKNTGTLRIQTFAARQSAPMEGVTVAVQGDGFTLHCITDATGSAADIPIEAPACTLSLDEDSTTRPYAVVSLTAAKSGYRTVRIEGIQIFAGQITLAQPTMIPVTEEGKDIPNAPIVIPPHPLFAGSGGSGAQPVENCTPRVLDKVIIPKNITVHLGKPAASARNVTVSFRDYIANVASSEVYPTWADENNPTGHPELFRSKIPFNRYFLFVRPCILRPDHYTVHQQHCKLPGQVRNLCQFPHTLHLGLDRSTFFLLLFQLGFQLFDSGFCTAYFIEERLVHLKELRRIDQAGHLIQIKLLHRLPPTFNIATQLAQFLPHCLISLPDRVILFWKGNFFRVKIVCRIRPDTFQYSILQCVHLCTGLVAAHFRCALVHPAADITYPGAVCPGRTASLLHDTAAAAAHYFPCQRMDPAAGSASGAPLHHPLNRFKRFSLNDSFMHIFYNDPLRFWNPNRLFRLVTYLFMLSLHHISDIKLIMQYLIYGGTAPKSRICILQCNAVMDAMQLLIGRWTWNFFIIQDACDLVCADSVESH